MRAPIVVAVAQPPCVPLDVAANARLHAAVVRSASKHGGRVVVFPELSLTGYELDGADLVAPDDDRLQPLVAACAEAGAAALVGAPVGGAEPGREHIGVLSVSGSGATVAYRKCWLGEAETVRFSPGADVAVLDVDGWRLGLAVCKDTGVEQHAADVARAPGWTSTSPGSSRPPTTCG